MAITNHERVGKALEFLKSGLGPFVARELKGAHKDRFTVEVARLLGDDRVNAEKPVAQWDAGALLKLMWDCWNNVFRLNRLILIDEWVAYARQLHDEGDLPAGSFETHSTFAQALTEAARAAKQCLVVISLPASDTTGSSHAVADDVEVGGERGRAALSRLRNVVGRVESSWRPASAEEGFEIVRRMLKVYRHRWTGTETFHRDGKQELGMGDCQLRDGEGQTRHMDLVMLAYSLLNASTPVQPRDGMGVPATDNHRRSLSRGTRRDPQVHARLGRPASSPKSGISSLYPGTCGLD